MVHAQVSSDAPEVQPVNIHPNGLPPKGFGIAAHVWAGRIFPVTMLPVPNTDTVCTALCELGRYALVTLAPRLRETVLALT